MSKKILTADQFQELWAKASTPEDYKALAEQAISQSADQERQLTTAAEFNKELQNQLLESDKSGKKYPGFKSGKDNYIVLHGVTLDEKTYSAKEIAENVDVQKKLIKSESSAISLQPKED